MAIIERNNESLTMVQDNPSKLWAIVPMQAPRVHLSDDRAGDGSLPFSVRRSVAENRAPTSLSVVIPTRNEESNVGLLASRLTAAMFEGLLWEIVVVDDSSDATPQVVNDLIVQGLPGRLIHRPPWERTGGLGGAVLAGLGAAHGEVIVVMDGDLQHPPELVPVLASIVAMGAADIAIASRYSVGGDSVGLNGFARRTVSQLTRQASRLSVPGVWRIRDPLSGFFALRRDVLTSGPRSSEGFKVLLDILRYGDWTSAIEVPFGLERRQGGTSKADAAEGARFIRQLCRLTVSRQR
jgi:dolichol-phosphate mannosyltransferase